MDEVKQLLIKDLCIEVRQQLGVRHGCKHSKVDQKNALVYKSHDFLGQTPISSSKMLFKIDYFSR